MKYRVEVSIEDGVRGVNLHGYVVVEADDPDDAKDEAAEAVRESAIDTLRAEEVGA